MNRDDLKELAAFLRDSVYGALVMFAFILACIGVAMLLGVI